jgi:anti-sigma B factor antagonist
MEIAVSDAGDVKVVRIEGRLDTQTSADAQTQLTRLIDQGTTKVVVNFEKLDYISSTGLNVLLKAAKQLKGNSGELRICSLNEFVQEVFEISGFCTILSVFNSETDALSRF